ncbi:hypothetical protein A2U01_0117607, partial [Trifolium medium]|nr:hypothetical protein [Trifolium medium]
DKSIRKPFRSDKKTENEKIVKGEGGQAANGKLCSGGTGGSWILLSSVQQRMVEGDNKCSHG